jgi:hypothetical protein
MPAQAGIHNLQKARKSLLFCEQKRSKKNFCNLDRAGQTALGPKLIKVLCFFFSKKKFLLT